MPPKVLSGGHGVEPVVGVIPRILTNLFGNILGEVPGGGRITHRSTALITAVTSRTHRAVECARSHRFNGTTYAVAHRNAIYPRH